MNLAFKIQDGLISLVYPRRCPICDNPVKPFGALICDGCITNVKLVGETTCYKCGKPLEDDAQEYCEDCLKHVHLYKHGMSVFEYKSISDSIYRYKYKGRREYAAWYGEYMTKALSAKLSAIKADALIPVPIHRSKMRARGYNQATLIAKELSKQTGIPVYDKLVTRVKKTTPLKDLTPEERNNILRGAFKLTTNDVKLESIVIIDDIYTTGSTIDAVALPFLRAGIKNIYFATLAIGRGV